MQYETFKHLIIEKLHSHFQEPKNITIHEITKINGFKMEGLVILDQGFNIAPTLYLDYYFKKYESGTDFTDVLEELIMNYEANRPRTPIDVSFFTDYEQAKHRIVFKVINYEKNRELLENIPHFPFLDLAIVFYCLVHSDATGNASILIHHQHMQRWNATPEQLMQLSMENTPSLLEYELRSMESILSDNNRIRIPSLYPMYVLTNYSHLNGACCILYKNLLKQFSEKINSDFFILPSSIHEVILLPANDISAIEALSEMVKEVNTVEVSEDEILSDHAYYYSRRDNCMSM